jgi:hypothetical protein
MKNAHFGGECLQVHKSLNLKKLKKTAPGFKAAKDRLTLLFCENTLGDFLVKPMLVMRWHL